MSVGVDAFQPRMSERHAWTIDTANFTNVLSIYGGHFGDCGDYRGWVLGIRLQDPRDIVGWSTRGRRWSGVEPSRPREST